MKQAIRENKMARAISRRRRPLTVAAITAAMVIAPAVDAFAYVHNG